MVDLYRVGQPRRQIVGHRCQMLGQAAAGGGPSANYTRAEHRLGFYTPNVEVSDLQVVWGGWFNSNGEQSNPVSLTVDEACEVNSTFKRFLINGASSATLVANQTLYSDILSVDLPANTLLWLRGEAVVASGSTFPQGYYTSITGDGVFNSTQASQVVGTGAMSLPSGGEVAAGGFAPIALLGRPRVKIPAVALIGDSIAWGNGDTADTNGNLGWLARGLWSVNGGALPQYRATRSGDTLALNTVTNSDKKRSMLQFCTHAICALGSNDIASAVSLATIQSQMQGVWSACKRRGLIVYQTMIPTRTTSSDSWATTGNQTVTSGFTVGGLCDQVNAWIATQVGGGLLDGTIDPRPYWQDAANKWIVTGAANYATADGTHPSSAVNITAAAAVNTVATTW